MSDKQILISDDLYMMVRALEFFVDYKFNTGTWMQQEYIKRMNEIDQNEYAILCKRLGGKTRFEPANGSGTPAINGESPATIDGNDFSRNEAYIEHRKEYPYDPQHEDKTYENENATTK